MPAFLHAISAMGEMIQEIKNIDPEVFLVKYRAHYIVQSVLSKESVTLSKLVEEAHRAVLSQHRENHHYFDVTAQYGDLVSILEGPVHLCCRKRKVSIGEWLFLYSTPAMLFAGVVASASASIHKIQTGDRYDELPHWLVAFFLLSFFTAIFIKLLGSESQSNTSREIASFFWTTMLKKAKEIDVFIKNNNLKQIPRRSQS